ncbi:MAG TPA: rhodanese-like domain-containing protein [Myxococcaceae bacterium]|nr:rhodanese-like domain-containing protein [Myxococcaceae bacterium]
MTPVPHKPPESGPRAPTYLDVPPEALRTLPAGTRWIDVREPVEFDGPLGHLPGSELIPIAGIEAAAVSWDREIPLLLICRSGARSGRAAIALHQMGFKHLYNLAGGMVAVRMAGVDS